VRVLTLLLCFAPALAFAEQGERLRLVPLERLEDLAEEARSRGSWDVNMEDFLRKTDLCAQTDVAWYAAVAQARFDKVALRTAKSAEKCWEKQLRKSSGDALVDGFVLARAHWTGAQRASLRAIDSLLAGNTEKRCEALREGIEHGLKGTEAFDGILPEIQGEDLRVYARGHRDECARTVRGLREQLDAACGGG
jgi:hypothetical protein